MCCNDFRPLFLHPYSEFPKCGCKKSDLKLLRHTVRPQIHNIYIINEFPTKFHNSTASISIYLKIKEMACYFFCPLLYVKKILCVFEIRGAKGPPHIKFRAHICMERGRYPHARSSMPVNCPIKGFLFLESHTIEVLLTLLWEFGNFVKPNYVFTSTLCYSPGKK